MKSIPGQEKVDLLQTVTSGRKKAQISCTKSLRDEREGIQLPHFHPRCSGHLFLDKATSQDCSSRSEYLPVSFSQILPPAPERLPSSSWSLSQRDPELQSSAFSREGMAAWRVLCSRKLSFLPNYFHFVWLSDARMLFVPHPEAIQGNDSLSSTKTMPWMPTDAAPLYF